MMPATPLGMLFKGAIATSLLPLPLLLITSVVQLAVARPVPVPSLDVPALTRDASLIVVGQVISVQEGERGNYEIREHVRPARRMQASLRVDRALKGETGSELSFMFLLPDQPVGYQGVADAQFGMFFFRSGADGLTFASPYYPFIVATPQDCKAAGNPLERVVAELACVLDSFQATTRERAEAISALGSVKTTQASEALRRAAKEMPNPLNLLAACALLQRDNISALPLVEEHLHYSSSTLITDEGYYRGVNLADALGHIKDKSAIPTLSRLIEFQDAQTRRGTARALRNIGTEEAIPPLAKALYDDDWEVRWLAVMGLAGITGQSRFYPSYDAFKQNEQWYLSHWRAWAQKRGRARTQ
ncbi:MAG TPA: HEAT repeat domain-containing protein [Blastocatellia bacterium]|nr:HEAT repeat domain-containing protein [Blastocatellia bacterium]